MVTRKTTALIALVTTIAALAGGCNDHRADAAGQLISAFQSSCVTSGQWTNSALAHNQALVSVVQNLKNTDACKGFAATLGTIQSLSGQIQGLLTNQSYTDYRLAEEKLQELTLALQSAPNGSDLSIALSNQIVTTQVDLAEKRFALSTSNQTSARDRYANSTAMFANLMQGMLAQTDGISACLKQSPSAAIELATNLMGIGGSFISPILGAGVAVVGQLINVAVEFARASGPNDAIWKLYSAQMPLALGCGLEAMTELYCNANDAFDLLELQSKSYPTPGEAPKPLWLGLDILGRRLPVLNQWLLSVKNGVRPTDPLEADRQNSIWRKLERLDEYYRNVFADLNYTQKLFNGAIGNTPIQNDIVVKFLKDAARELSGSNPDGTPTSPNGNGNGSNPFRDKSTDADSFACWLVLGPNATCPEHDTLKGEIGERYIRNKLLASATILGLFSNWDAIYEQVKKQVDLEFAQTITADPDALLASAREAAVDNLSPRAVLDLIKQFLQNTLDHDDGRNPQKLPLIRDTLALINNALAILDNDDAKLTALDRISKLFQQFQLAHGLQFFNERIGNFIQWDIQDRLRKGELPSDVTDVLQSAGGDIRSRLTASGVTNLLLLSHDLNKARSLTERNIEIFKKFFEPSFVNALKDLDKAVKRSGEPTRGSNRPNGQLLGQLCTLILSTSPSGQDWPKAMSWELCANANLDSIYPDPQGTMTIEVSKLRAQLAGKPYKVRMCSFHRYLRAGRLAEALRNAPIPKKPGLLEGELDVYRPLELWNLDSVLRFIGGADSMLFNHS